MYLILNACMLHILCCIYTHVRKYALLYVVAFILIMACDAAVILIIITLPAD